jgi:hypothetical protein
MFRSNGAAHEGGDRSRCVGPPHGRCRFSASRRRSIAPGPLRPVLPWRRGAHEDPSHRSAVADYLESGDSKRGPRARRSGVARERLTELLGRAARRGRIRARAAFTQGALVRVGVPAARAVDATGCNPGRRKLSETEPNSEQLRSALTAESQAVRLDLSGWGAGAVMLRLPSASAAAPECRGTTTASVPSSSDAPGHPRADPVIPATSSPATASASADDRQRYCRGFTRMR